MKLFLNVLAGAALTFSSLVLSPSCRADADVTFTQTLSSTGAYHYEYTLSNSFTDLGYNAYDLFLDFGSFKNILDAEQPAGWVDLVSLGAFPVSTNYYTWASSDFQYDVLPGGAKLFSLTSLSNNLGAIGYQVTVANPLIPASPLLFSGTAAPTATNVPEPSTLVLALTLGLSGAGLYRRRKRIMLSGC